MDGRRIRVVVAVLLLVLAAVVWAARDRAEPGGSKVGVTSKPAGEATGSSPGDVGSRDTSAPGGPDAGHSLDDTPIADETLYELVEALRGADLAPGLNETLTVEYQGDLETIRVRGSFENTSAESITLERKGGSWFVR